MVLPSLLLILYATRLIGLLLRVHSSPAQTPRTPGRSLCPGEHRLKMIPLSLLLFIKSSLGQSIRAPARYFLFSRSWTVGATCVLREVHGATAAVALWAMARRHV